MWKRWSLKPAASATSDGNHDKATSPSTTAEDSAALEPSVKPETLNDDTSHENGSHEVIESPTSLVQPSTDPPADGKPEPHDRSATQAPVPQTPSENTHKEEAAAVRTDAGPSPELADSSLPNGTPSPHASPPPNSAPEDEATQAAPEDEISEFPSDSALPADARADGALGATDRQAEGDAVDTPANTLSAPRSDHPLTRARRLSFRSLAFFYGRDKQPPPISPTSPSSVTLKSKPAEPVNSKPKSPPKPKLSRSEKHALSSAIQLRTLIIGPGSFPSSPSEGSAKGKSTRSKSTGAPSPPNLKKLKAQLLKPKSANAVISQLRRLPLPDGPSFHVSGSASSESVVTHPDAGGAPIHAVCLACTDGEADEKHFSRLRASHTQDSSSSPLPQDAFAAVSPAAMLSVGTASLESLIPVLRDLRLVSLLASPDLGFGQPVDEEVDSGILTGSVPSAGTVIDGFEEVTKQLMSLGFATSKAVFPSHAGIYPPEDRMSVLTYWWGLELVLPEPSVQYLSRVKSISNSLLNFLSALALFNNGVREVLPFIRYVANFVDFEWAAVKAQDKGKGVVCAATWVMPAAMVPRPWDFPSRPASKPNAPTTPTTTPTAAPPLPPKPAPAQDISNGHTGGGKPPTRPPPQESYPPTPPNVFYPPAPAMPMLPQLMVTPATLPRSSGPLPQEAAA